MGVLKTSGINCQLAAHLYLPGSISDYYIVKTASSLQVREKVYKGSSEEWKKFEKYLDRAFDELPN